MRNQGKTVSDIHFGERYWRHTQERWKGEW